MSGPQLPHLHSGVVGLEDLPAPTHRLHPCGCPSPAPSPAPAPTSFTSGSLPLRKLADCAQLLDTDDMVRSAVPDSKCVYTYIQELYRSLVQKGLVKTKKK